LETSGRSQHIDSSPSGDASVPQSAFYQAQVADKFVMSTEFLTRSLGGENSSAVAEMIQGRMGEPFIFAVLDFIELVSLILGHFFATLYRLTYPG
jgi:hypothetical protein